MSRRDGHSDPPGSSPGYVADLLDHLRALVVELETIQDNGELLDGRIDDGPGVWSWLEDWARRMDAPKE